MHEVRFVRIRRRSSDADV